MSANVYKVLPEFEGQNFVLRGVLASDADDLFYCDKIATKAKPFAKERISALQSVGFALSKDALIGQEGEEYYDYFVIHK